MNNRKQVPIVLTVGVYLLLHYTTRFQTAFFVEDWAKFFVDDASLIFVDEVKIVTII